MSEDTQPPAEATSSVPLLTAPSNGGNSTQVHIESDQALKLDGLGPMVVNSDGTLSRIANWESMTEAERDRTMRVLAARNKIRLAKQSERA
ncbi:hypothetical protein BV22DRAFT_1131377 [Leucogyrophana mollusca]|uniref:Uncharacterized protein n=1 Tax=Leucogyrophana mollusca TaxID=85980 RepID=A0ACB8B9N9_9AGAM|nr:hypothetical protein BV22DRAFT_1131377 [Leucogyrophana mollusca]